MTKLTENAKGIYVISATPFTDDGNIDWGSTDRLTDFYLAEGVHGITVLGVMGEAPKLSNTEQMSFVERVLKRVDGRIPVVVGVSNPGIDNLSLLSHQSMEAGAAGVMIAPIPGLRTEDQIYIYFAKVFATLGTDVPVCLQDYPPSNNVYMSVATINRLLDDFPQIVMFKHEDMPGLRKLSQIRRGLQQSHRRLSILSANGGLYVPQEMRRGADGVMTGFAFTGMLVEMYQRFVDGDADAAEDLYDLYLPLIRHEQQFGIGLAIRKQILKQRGIITSAAVRQPGPALDTDDMKELHVLLERLRRKLEEAGEKLPSGLC
jgi:4-hydroxy-tetrahydrodipicolinate synthase